MAILALHPNNKNQYRKYPLKQGSDFQSTDGYLVPDDLIVNCTITSTYGRHRIYVKQLYYKNATARIVVASVLNDEILGVFTGAAISDFSTLALQPFVRFVAGTLTIGSLASLTAITRVLNFINPLAGGKSELEESTIFCYTPPNVTSIRDKQNNELRGNVAFGTLTALTKNTDNYNRTTEFAALYPDAVFNLSDKSSYIATCPNPIIRSINGVTPYPAGVGSAVNDGNVYIVGVKPVIFYGVAADSDPATAGGVVQIITDGVTLDSLCTQKHKLLPPVDVTGFTLGSLEFKNKYYSKPALPAYPEGSPNYPLARPQRLASNFNSTTRPEYYYWPQFVKSEYYSYWATEE